ncbi:hypothetical protein G7Y89_g15359 [Cudoniella acicularis]|uniref:Auxiliary Activity family 9 catalytic domain-containing protein n=1 Tax=Cudoniella acicularis TaxID=354080 RepID=A0A8H4QNT5_9HELO|nr:hypothetical protein G7Y89_g15359 [Cudoniella acicularis]
MSFSKIATFTGALAFASSVAAHGTVTGIVADGVYYEGYHANFQYVQTQPVVVGWSIPEDLSNGFIAPDAYATGDIICHLNATNAKTSATVKAGGTVEMQWTAWPSSHHGPVIDYLASCNGDCTTVDKTTLEFFKIDAVGLLDDTTVPGSWASDTLIANNNSWTVTIPTDIAPGNYVLRHEIIALHSAEEADGTQNYPQCFNLEVTGLGTATPSGTLGEALYTETDPGIEINIYQSLSTYVIPGPTLYSGAISMSQTSQPAATSIAPVGTVADPIATSAAEIATTSGAQSAVVSSSAAAGAASSVTSSPSAGITSAAGAEVSSAPFSNGTTPSSKSRSACKANTSSASKSKSACKAKNSSSAFVSLASKAVQAVSVSSEVATTVTIPTSLPAASTEAIATTATSAAISEVTVTGTSAASTSTSGNTTDLPSGTTLSSVLSWISSFWDKVKGTDYNGDSALARREHARDVVAANKRQFDDFSVGAIATGFSKGTDFAHATDHDHHHAHGTGSAGFAKPTGASVGSTKPTGSLAAKIAQSSGVAHASGHHYPHGTGKTGGSKATGVKPTGTFPSGSARPSGAGKFRKLGGN